MKTITKLRIFASIVLAVIYAIFIRVYDTLYSPITGTATAAQFDDSVHSYAIAKLIRDEQIKSGIFWILAAFLLLIWILPIVKSLQKRKLLALALLGILSSCTPVKVLDVVEVKSNETAWAIPLDAMSQSGQVKFNSIDFLNQKKIPAKRIMVDKVQRKVGRFYWDIEWIPATRVIQVDRSLVTREWTDAGSKTTAQSQGIGVVTRDSVKLRVGLTITASIDEDDASTYLYYHGARSLADVLDQNIRSFAVSELTKEYSKLSLSEAQTKGDEIYGSLFGDAAKAFKSKGVTIQYLGNAEGLTYADQAVQTAINARYLAEQSVQTAGQEQNAQKIRNATNVLTAQAQADAAQKLFSAKEATGFQNELNIKLITAQAQMTMAQKWNGSMPTSILPSNSPMLMNLGIKP